MSTTEVFAIEVKQYVDAAGERQTIVPTILGQTEAAKAKRRAGGGAARWVEESFIDKLASDSGDAVATIAQSVIDWAKAHEDLKVEYGRGGQSAHATLRFKQGSATLTPLRLRSSGLAVIPFDVMGRTTPFSNRASRAELRRRLNDAVPAAQITAEGKATSRGRFRLEALSDEEVRQAFFGCIDWAFDEAVRAQAIR